MIRSPKQITMKEQNDFNILADQSKRDRYGRRYPYQIILQNGEQIIGLYSGSSSKDGIFELIWFKVLENIDTWVNDPDYLKGRMVYLKPDEIVELDFWQAD